jgi:hypothetical protein
MKLSKNIIALLILLLFFMACTKTYKPRPKYKANVTDLKADVEIARFDLDFFSMDTADIAGGLEKLKAKHGDFVQTFLVDIVNDGRPLPLEQIAKVLLSIPEAAQLEDSIKKAFPDLKFAEKEIEQMMAYKIHFFGEKISPVKKIFTFNTLYKYGTTTHEDVLGLGLDFFLGENHVPYFSVEMLRPQYKRRTLTKEHMTAALASAIADNVVSNYSKAGGSKMIDMMLYEGKKFYVKACLMPETADSIIYNFSDYQIKYCEYGETALWEHLGKENLLFSSKKSDFQKYVSEGPFNPKLDLPGNSASWLGAQMVAQAAGRLRKEMKANNPNQSIREIDRKVMEIILKESNSQFFMQKYKPTKP